MSKLERQSLVVLALALLLVGAGCASRTPAPTLKPHPETIAQLVERELVMPLENSGASVGVMVAGIDGVQLYAHDPTRLLVPASVQKVMVAADAMAHLGPDFSWRTDLLATGEIDSTGTMHGDLILRGTWDPTLGNTAPYTGWPFKPFETWATQVGKAGVQQVDGRLVAVGNLFIPDGWEAADLAYSYAPAVSQLAWNDGLYTTFAGEVGDSLFWDIWPDPLVWSEDHGQSRVWPQTPKQPGPELDPPFNHSLWPGLNDEDMRPAYDPRALTADALRAVLRVSGIDGPDSVEVLDKLETSPSDTLFLLNHQSPPLTEVLRATLALSSNAWCEMVQATVADSLGENPFGKPHWPAVLDSMGVASRGLRATDACGLSRKNNLSAATLNDLLLAGWERWGDEWLGIFPKAHEPRTSLATRLEGYEGRIVAKTGSMSRTRSLAGYLLRDGEPVATFTIILNNVPWDATDTLDRTVMLLADRFSPQPATGVN